MLVAVVQSAASDWTAARLAVAIGARGRRPAGRGRTGAAERSRHCAGTRGDASMMPALNKNDVGHEKVTRGGVVDRRAYRRPTRITRRHLFRVGQRAARSVPERRSAKFRRASRFLLVQGRQRAQKPNNRRGQLAAYIESCPTLAVMPSAFFSRRQSHRRGVSPLGGLGTYVMPSALSQ